jgi:hypothetical protein
VQPTRNAVPATVFVCNFTTKTIKFDFTLLEQKPPPGCRGAAKHIQHSSRAIMARKRMLLIEYDESAAADVGVLCCLAGPVAYSRKEPVGHIFHYKVMLQQGFIGEHALLIIMLSAGWQPPMCCVSATILFYTMTTAVQCSLAQSQRSLMLPP